jgi:DNA end-binding protein Ku
MRKEDEQMAKKTETNGHRAGKIALPRPMWAGSISFGLVNIPIRMHTGVKKKAVRFHLLHDKDNSRLIRKYFCAEENKEVPNDEIKKGYDVGSEEHVVVDKEELEELRPKATRTIDILYFVDYKKIDPAYFERPYYLMPEETAKKSYQLLVESLEKTGKAGICQFVLHNRQYVGLLRAEKTVLMLETMYFEDEVITVDELKTLPPTVKVNPREVKAAEDLIESLSTDFEPEKLRDEYRVSVLKLIDKKQADQATVTAAGAKGKMDEEEQGPEVIDLMSALKKSLEQVKKNKPKKAA